MDDEENVPLSILRPCYRCGNEFTPGGMNCAPCQHAVLTRIRDWVACGWITDWATIDNFGPLYHGQAMRQSYSLVEQARSDNAHMSYSTQIALIMNRAYQEHPGHWGLSAWQGDIPE